MCFFLQFYHALCKRQSIVYLSFHNAQVLSIATTTLCVVVVMRSRSVTAVYANLLVLLVVRRRQITIDYIIDRTSRGSQHD